MHDSNHQIIRLTQFLEHNGTVRPSNEAPTAPPDDLALLSLVTVKTLRVIQKFYLIFVMRVIFVLLMVTVSLVHGH